MDDCDTPTELITTTYKMSQDLNNIIKSSKFGVWFINICLVFKIMSTNHWFYNAIFDLLGASYDRQAHHGLTFCPEIHTALGQAGNVERF
jgi:hypothetical protein